MLKDAQKNLEKYGFTSFEAELYVALLQMGASTLGNISKRVNSDHAQVFRGLNKLIEKQVIYSLLDNQRIYVAKEPEIGLFDLIDIKKKEINRLEADIAETVNALPRVNGVYANALRGMKGGFSYYLKTGRMNFVKDLIKDANTSTMEILRVQTANAFARMKSYGIAEAYISAVERGVRVTVITVVNDKNLNFAQELRDIFDIFSINDVNLSFQITDGTNIIICGRYDDNDESFSSKDTYLISNDHSFAQSFVSLFKKLQLISSKLSN